MGEITACTGPTQIAQALKELQPVLEWGISNPWAQLSVRRSGHPLGTLAEVRQSVHRWQIEMAAWKAWMLRNDVEG